MLMRCLSIALLAACGSAGSANPDAKTEASVCLAEREAAIDRSCSIPDDCVLVSSADCCGVVWIAPIAEDPAVA